MALNRRPDAANARYYLLFVISLVDRAVNIAGITTHPDESWHSKRYLMVDPDAKYSKRLRRAIRTLDQRRMPEIG
jgi:hypothetical protein